jgi:hypothetical protein
VVLAFWDLPGLEVPDVTDRPDPYAGAETLMELLQQDIERDSTDMASCTAEGDDAGAHYYLGRIDAYAHCIHGVEIYVLSSRRGS